MRISDWSSDVCSSDLIDVDQRRPDGLAGEIGIERALPPDSARIGRVAPEIGDRLAHHLAGHRDLALVVEDGAGALAVGFEAGAGGDQLVGGRISFLTQSSAFAPSIRSEEHTSDPVTNAHLVCRLLL